MQNKPKAVQQIRALSPGTKKQVCAPETPQASNQEAGEEMGQYAEWRDWLRAIIFDRTIALEVGSKCVVKGFVESVQEETRCVKALPSFPDTRVQHADLGIPKKREPVKCMASRIT